MRGYLKKAAGFSVSLLLIFAVHTAYALDVVINEFMALNNATIQDGDGEYSDWIELYNSTASPVNLGGWFLTDASDDLQQWQFPDVTIPANGFLLVFASGKDRAVSGAPLHTNFKLSASGEYLGLIRPDGTTVAYEYTPAYPEQQADVSYGIGPTDQLQYFFTPTPSQANQQDNAGEVQFSHDGGLFADNFSLTLTPSVSGATIRYTTDGTVPSESSTAFSGSISVTGTTMVRAKAFKSGVAPGPVANRSYLKLAANSETQGFSSNLPIVVVDTQGFNIDTENNPETDYDYRPAFSIFIDVNESTSRANITDNPVLTSYMGMRVRGNSSASDWAVTSWPKKQYRIETWENYAEYGTEGEDRSVSLFGFPQDSDWILHAPYSDKTLMRNYLAYKWSNDMGRYTVRTKFVEVFLNKDNNEISYPDDYVGVYIFMEKIKRDDDRVDIKKLGPEDIAEPDITGGYLLVEDRKKNAGDGFETPHIDSDDVSILYADPSPDEITAEQKTYIQGYINDFETALYGSDFTDSVSGYSQYIAVGSFIDHQILVEMTQNVDGLKYSTYMHKDRDKKLNMGPAWDYNLTMGNSYHGTSAPPDNPDGSVTWSYNPWIWQARHDYSWWGRLWEDPDFEQRWNDRWAELRKTVLTDEKIFQDINDAKALLTEAAGRNFQKWPVLGEWIFGNTDDYQNRTTYLSEVDYLTDWLTDRLSYMDGSNATLITSMPNITPAEGLVTQGTLVSLSNPKSTGTIYYTLDGSDPRGTGGVINGTAYTGSIAISNFTRITARIRKDDGSWTPPVVASYATAADNYSLEITEIMYNPPGMNGIDGDNFEFIEVENIGTGSVLLDGVTFSAGIDFSFPNGATLEPGEYLLLVSNETEFRNKYPDLPADVPVYEYSGSLNNGGETLTLSNGIGTTIFSVAYDDVAPWPVGADDGGGSLVLVSADAPNEGTSWRASTYWGGSPGTADEDQPGLDAVIAALQIVVGISPASPSIPDIGGDRQVGMEEAIYLLQVISGLR